MVHGNAFSQYFHCSIDNLYKSVHVLAADSLEGRGTGTLGEQMAAKYIADGFAQAGLEQYDSSYYLPFALKKLAATRLAIRYKNVFIPSWTLYHTSNYAHRDTVSESILFVGYGTEAEIESLDLRQQAVLLLAATPEQALQTMERLQKNFQTRAFYVVFERYLDEVARVWGDYYNLTQYQLASDFEQAYSRRVQESWVTLNTLDSADVFYSFPDSYERAFGLSDKELFHLADENRAAGYTLLGADYSWDATTFVNYSAAVESMKSKNISGFIRGKDTTETVVLTAHYDHLGIQMGEVFNGADDNASGVAALLEIANVLAAEDQPERNIQFIAFSAEELGLFGSKEYLKHPVVPLEELVAAVNIDMIGRGGRPGPQEMVYVLTYGDMKHEMDRLARHDLPVHRFLEVSKRPDKSDKVGYRTGSDHYSFVAKGIPSAVFFTGLHGDYHTPYDTADKIDYPSLGEIANLIVRYIYALANEKEEFPLQELP